VASIHNVKLGDTPKSTDRACAGKASHDLPSEILTIMPHSMIASPLGAHARGSGQLCTSRGDDDCRSLPPVASHPGKRRAL